MAVGRKADYTDQIPALWAKDLFFQAEKMTFWQRFEGGEGSGMPIIRRDDLEKDPGDTVKLDIVMSLTGAGSTGDTTLSEGNEEKMDFRQISVTVDALKHAVRWSKLTKILITHNMRKTALRQLRKWLAGKLDDAVFGELTGTGATTIPTKNKFFAGDATSRNTIDLGDELTLDLISKVKAKAKTNIRMEPLRLEGGEEFYGMVVHPYANLRLKLSAEYKQAQREAGVRGQSNPLFTGADAVYDGVIIYEADRIPWSDNTNTPPVKVADNVFFGSQACARAYAYYPDWREQEFSYGEEIGVATFVVLGEKLIAFDLNATETPADATDDTALGSMVVYTYAPEP